MPSLWLPLLILALLAFAGVRAMSLHVDLTRPAAVPVASVTVILTAQTSTTFSLAAIVADASGNQLLGRTVTWSSSNTSIAIVDGAGLVSEGGTAGTATITATCDGITGTMTVTVSVPAPVATTLVWQDSAPTFTAFGQTAYSRAVVKDQYGAAMSPQPTITYTSGTPADVTVGISTGLCTAVANGSSLITAQVTGTVGGIVNPSLTQTATVSQTVASITGVSPTLSALDTDSGSFSPVGKDANNNTVSGATFAYSSDQPSILSVNASTGAWAGQSAGTAHVTITASPGGATFVVTATVTHAPGLTATPSSFSGAAGATQQEAFAIGATDVTSDVIAYSADETIATISSAPDQPTVGAGTNPTSSTLDVPVTGTGPYGGTPTTVALEVYNGTSWVRQTAVSWTGSKTATQTVTATGLTASKDYTGKIRAVTITSAGESYPSSAIPSGATAAAGIDARFDFAATTNYVTHAAGTNVVLGGTSLWPQTDPNGVTYGWDASTGLNASNRTSTDPPELASINRVTDGTSVRVFKVQTNKLGATVTIHLGLHDGVQDNTTVTVKIVDAGNGNAVLATVISAALLSYTQVRYADGSTTATASWDKTAHGITVTLNAASKLLGVQIGPNTNSLISHLHVTEA